MGKPFRIDDLLARIHALVPGPIGGSDLEDVGTFGPA